MVLESAGLVGLDPLGGILGDLLELCRYGVVSQILISWLWAVTRCGRFDLRVVPKGVRIVRQACRGDGPVDDRSYMRAGVDGRQGKGQGVQSALLVAGHLTFVSRFEGSFWRKVANTVRKAVISCPEASLHVLLLLMHAFFPVGSPFGTAVKGSTYALNLVLLGVNESNERDGHIGGFYGLSL